MAQKFEEKIKVKYQVIENGVITTKENMLVDIPEQEKESIISLAIFPVLNKDDSENKVVKDIGKYITNFPMLQTISYPKQFTSVNVGLIQKNGCPNLHQIIRTVPEGYEGETSLSMKGSKVFHSSIDTREDKMTGFASLLPSGQTSIDVIEVPVKPAIAKTSTTKKVFITKDIIDQRLNEMSSKISQIADRIGENNVPSTEDIQEMLDKFVGIMTEEELNSVIDAVNNINVNVATTALNGIVESTIKDQILAISRDVNEQFKGVLQGFAFELERMRANGATDENLLAYIRNNIPKMLASDKEVVTRLKLLDKTSLSTYNGVKDTEEKVDDISEKIDVYKDEILQGVNKYVDDAKNYIVNSDVLTNSDKQYLHYCMAIISSQTASLITGKDNTLFNEIKERLDAMPTTETMEDDDKKINNSILKLVTELQNIRVSHSDDADKLQTAVNNFIKGKIPELIVTNRKFTDKLFPKVEEIGRRLDDMDENLGAINASVGNTEAATELINETLGKYFDVLTNGVNLSSQSKDDISNLLSMYAKELYGKINEHNNPLLEEISGKIPTDKTIENIVYDALDAHRLVDNTFIRPVMIDKITGTIINAMGGLEGRIKDNVDGVKTFVQDLVKDEEFVAQYNKILNDSDLAKCSSIKEVKDKISKNHSEELQLINDLVKSISKMPTNKDISDALGYQSSYILKRLGIGTELKDPTLMGLIKQIDMNNSKAFDQILEECKNKGMTVDDMKNFLSSDIGKETLSTAVGLASVQASITAVGQELSENKAKIEELSNQVKDLTAKQQIVIPSSLNVYNGSYGLASGVIAGGRGIDSIPSGFVSYVSDPFTYPLQINPNLDIYINNSIRNQITNMFGVMGVKTPANIDPRNTKDQVIADLNKENEARKKEIAELKDSISKLTKVIEEMNRSKIPTAKQEENKTEKDKAKDSEQKKNVAPVKPVATIKTPEVKKQTFKTKSVEMMDILAEPKMTRGQKFKKWLKRHPLALTAIGIGAGALIGAGAGVIAAGGVGSLIAHSIYFEPTLRTLGFGALIGLGAGAIGEGVGRITGLGKKDRLYKKFLKEKEKCDAYKQSLELMERAIENERAAIDSSIENMKSCKKLKQMKRYKKANMSKAKKLSKLRSKQRILKSDYKAQVEKFLQAKKELNEYEDLKGKTTAMGGNLQELRKVRKKAQEELENAEDEEEQEIIKEQLATEEQILDANAGAKISSLSSSFKTGDAEAYKMLKEIKGKSQAMNNIMTDIENRNSKKKDVETTVEMYDQSEIAKYAKEVTAKGNEVDKANLKALLSHAKETNKKASETLQIPEDKLEQLMEAKKKFEEANKTSTANTGAKDNDSKNHDGLAR